MHSTSAVVSQTIAPASAPSSSSSSREAAKVHHKSSSVSFDGPALPTTAELMSKIVHLQHTLKETLDENAQQKSEITHLRQALALLGASSTFSPTGSSPTGPSSYSRDEPPSEPDPTHEIEQAAQPPLATNIAAHASLMQEVEQRAVSPLLAVRTSRLAHNNSSAGELVCVHACGYGQAHADRGAYARAHTQSQEGPPCGACGGHCLLLKVQDFENIG